MLKYFFLDDRLLVLVVLGLNTLVYFLALDVSLTQARVIRDEGASVKEVLPGD